MNTNFNTTNPSGFDESGINSLIDQYPINGHIMLRSRDDLASNIDGTQKRLRIRNFLVTIFDNDDSTDQSTRDFMSAFRSTEDDDCEYEILSLEETERLWGIIPETGGVDNVLSQFQTTLPLGNESQSLILSDNNSSHHHTSDGDLGQSFYDTWDRNVINDRMAGLSGSNQENIIENGRLATETPTGLQQLCSQYGMPDLTDQIPESTRPSQFPQTHTQITDHPHSDGNHSCIPQKRTRNRGATKTVQAHGVNVAEDLSDLDVRSEMDEINQGSHNTTKRNKRVRTKKAPVPRVEQRSYCMSRVTASLEEMKAIDPDYDEHPHKAFFPEKMNLSQQVGMKSILIPTRMIDLLNAHRKKAREEERKNFTGRKIPRDFKLQPARHKDFEAFQEARRKEEETRSYENRDRRFAAPRS